MVTHAVAQSQPLYQVLVLEHALQSVDLMKFVLEVYHIAMIINVMKTKMLDTILTELIGVSAMNTVILIFGMIIMDVRTMLLILPLIVFV